jgi:hypothetical protein
MKHVLLSLMLLVLAVPAHGQTPNDPRWEPWLGCWELYGQGLRDADDSAIEARRDLSGSTDPAPPRVCVSPVPPNGAMFVTTVGSQKTLDQTVIANGVERAVDDGECRGTQSEEWSANGLRLFARAQLTCAGEQTPRRVTGLALLARDGSWLDVQTVEAAGRENVRVRRYRRVADEASSAADFRPRIAASRFRLADIKEASAKISPRALEAALVETNTSFDLAGRDLIDLDNAGVAGSVVDVLVALSYPDRFVVERTRDDSGNTGVFGDPFFLDYGFLSPLDGLFYAPYYYSPFAYSYYGRLYNPGFFGPTLIVGRGSSELQPSGTGRVVNGLGYTRIRERGPEVTPVSSASATRLSSGAGASTRSSGSASSGSSSSGSGSSSSGGNVSSQGFSSGGSSGDTGRTAVPR